MDDRRMTRRAPAASRQDLWLHRYAVLLSFLTLLLIVAGGMVTSTGSGLAVPDWPTTYGQNMFTYPYSRWVGGIFYEHGHRLIASCVGFLTIVLAVWLQISEPRRWLRRLGWAALGMVILQGVLGGITVLYLLPTPVSVFHGCLAQVFLCTILSIAVFTSPRWMAAIPRTTAGPFPLPRLSAVLIAIVFGQLVLGAIMRHTESGLAVPDFPLAYGQLWPDLGEAAMEKYNHDRRWVHQVPQATRQQILIHMAHRLGALFAALAALITCLTALRRHGDLAAIRLPAVFILVLLAVQIGLGAWTVWSQRSPRVTTAHVAVGAAMLAACWLLTMASRRYLKVMRPADVPLVAVPQVTA